MSSFMKDIPDDVFDKTHHYYDKDGSMIMPSLIRSRSSYSSRTGGVLENVHERNKENAEESGLLHSVYMAAGIHHEITEDALEGLPRRFEAGSVKAKVTWFGALCLAGIGMFVEAYIIITTGQIKTVWHSAYPTCFLADTDQLCPQNIHCCGLFPNTPADANGTCTVDTNELVYCNDDGTYSDNLLCKVDVEGPISYSEFLGIMLGMLIFGSLADLIGRNSAGILTAILMIVGVMVMSFIDSPSLQTMFLVWSAFFGLFGLGVGGEYPLSAAGAAEHYFQAVEEATMDDTDTHRLRVLRDHERTARRGETIGFVFAMQGVGAVVGSIFLLVLLYFSGQNHVECDPSVRPGVNSAGVDSVALNGVWRSFYFFGVVFVTMVLLYRWLLVDEGESHEKIQARKQRRAKKLTYSLIFRTYGLRLIATGGCWFVWDMSFYGLKLFSGPIFNAINPSGSLLVQNGYLLVNNLIALIAYYIAAYIIDKPYIGRKNVQIIFFFLVSVIFLVMSSIFNSAGSAALMVLYFLSSFVGQFVNTTTYVMAAETYPAELRGTLHGFSAFLGKAGAFIATLTFSQVNTPTIFLICGVVGLIGCVLTLVFSVDLTHVSLSEHDAQLELILEGRPNEYKGKLNQIKHLSLFERMLGWHGEYDPDWAKKFVSTYHGGSAHISTDKTA